MSKNGSEPTPQRPRLPAFSKKQRECVNFKADGDLIVKGVPGSGKTVVIAGRAMRLIQDTPKSNDTIARVRVITYNKVLSEYVRALVLSQSVDVPAISTFDSWAMEALRSIGELPKILKDWERAPLIREAVEQTPGVPPRLANQITFWPEEFTWMKGRSLRTLAAYLDAKRTSRGTAIRVTAEDRRAVFAVFTAYERTLAQGRSCDWDDLAHLLLKYEHRIPRRFHALHTLVDEGQDLSAAEFNAIRALSEISLTIAADPAQKIYKTGFRWSDIGIGAVGRTKTLERAFRCSRPVAELAMSLKRHQPKLTDADEMPAEWLEFDKRDGPQPTVWKAATPTAKDQVLRLQAHSLIDGNPNDIVAVLCPTKKLVEQAAKTIGPRARLLRDDYDFATPGVLVSTIHSAKGLEFHHVVICGLENGVLPRKPAEDDEPDPESDLVVARQLLYVGMTRALKTLQLITGPKPCRFIDELDPQLYRELRA